MGERVDSRSRERGPNERKMEMPIGSGKVTVLNNKIAKKQKTTPVAHYKDNTSDLEEAALRSHQQFAHIGKPDDGSGKRARRGSFDDSGVNLSGGTVHAP